MLVEEKFMLVEEKEYASRGDILYLPMLGEEKFKSNIFFCDLKVKFVSKCFFITSYWSARHRIYLFDSISGFGCV